MRLDKLASVLSAVRSEYGLDATDLMVLDEVMRTKRVAGEVTIMEIVDKSKAASPATVHARIKLLCEMDLLKKSPHHTNLSYRMLDKGPEFDRLTKILGDL
jgi:predicted transcriptional regulator